MGKGKGRREKEKTKKQKERQLRRMKKKGMKPMPPWFLYKMVAMMYTNKLQAYSVDDSLNNPRQQFLDFIMDAMIHIYGLQSLARFHLQEMTIGLNRHAQEDSRLSFFRQVSGLVSPEDIPGPLLRPEALNFYIDILKTFGVIVSEDHLAKLSEAGFWSKFGLRAHLDVPAVYIEKTCRRLFSGNPAFHKLVVNALHSLKAQGKTKGPNSQDPGHKKSACSRVIKIAPETKGWRCDLDVFLTRAVEVWQGYNDEVDRMYLKNFHSWDINGDGSLSYDEFEQMVQTCMEGRFDDRTIVGMYRSALVRDNGEEGRKKMDCMSPAQFIKVARK